MPSSTPNKSYTIQYGFVKYITAYKRARKEHGEIKAWRQVEYYAPGETRFYVRRIKALMDVE
ncbi:MAG: hypothetical protein ABW141_03195 [Candidatus Thiodiazotropha endolucinida]